MNAGSAEKKPVSSSSTLMPAVIISPSGRSRGRIDHILPGYANDAYDFWQDAQHRFALFDGPDLDATVLAFREECQMPNHLLVVMANSAPDLDDEFNRWYDEEHLAWVLDALP